MLDLNAVTLQVRLVQDDQDQSSLAWKLATSTLPKVIAELRAAREATAKPCPRCGGKVALIGQDQEASNA